MVELAKIDFSHAFLQMEVKDSKEILTIHKGLFTYNCLSFGVKTAPAISQQTMDALLIGATAFIEDIIIASATQDELLICLNVYFMFTIRLNNI